MVYAKRRSWNWPCNYWPVTSIYLLRAALRMSFVIHRFLTRISAPFGLVQKNFAQFLTDSETLAAADALILSLYSSYIQNECHSQCSNQHMMTMVWKTSQMSLSQDHASDDMIWKRHIWRSAIIGQFADGMIRALKTMIKLVVLERDCHLDAFTLLFPQPITPAADSRHLRRFYSIRLNYGIKVECEWEKLDIGM